MICSRRIVTETICNSNYLSLVSINKLVADTVPIQYQDKVQIYADSKYYEYESTPALIIKVTYDREENDDEYEQRLIKEQTLQTLRRELELETLRKLKEKYGEE